MPQSVNTARIEVHSFDRVTLTDRQILTGAKEGTASRIGGRPVPSSRSLPISSGGARPWFGRRGSGRGQVVSEIEQVRSGHLPHRLLYRLRHCSDNYGPVTTCTLSDDRGRLSGHGTFVEARVNRRLPDCCDGILKRRLCRPLSEYAALPARIWPCE
jgi:hypothetical protein